ncbi:hypothetical protein NQ317_007797 [Molorchus minor]|uniref:Uncharacterized protein n=1 Tax=Molorchus minor TaxID=1323400 RepID=A0ABQ9IYW5_9CUCU|nr:hypothetical protein NQ317_007797 [Molorchus minor]
MSVIANILRCFCLCIVIEKGSWYPNQKPLNKNKNHRAILKNRFREDKSDISKPDWLKEWTISKGWIHNRSHLLELGKNGSEEDLVETRKETKPIMEKETYDRLSQTSSVQPEDIDDLLSLNSVIEHSQESKDPQLDFDRIDTISSSDDVSENYRQQFPENYNKYKNNDLSLPEIYKERLLINENKEYNFLLQFWKYIKPKRKQRNSYNCKFTINQLYDSTENIRFKNASAQYMDTIRSIKRNSLGRNIAIHNTLNSKTNLHEETIYECSEENSNQNSLNNIYFNPIYTPTIFPGRKYYDFHSNHNHVCKKFAFNQKSFRVEQNRLLWMCKKDDSVKARLKTEKYVIRHIRVRIMLSLRVGKVQKSYRTPVNGRAILSARNHQSRLKDNMIHEDEEMQRSIARIHEEQKRIGNGKTSIKIQNMR